MTGHTGNTEYGGVVGTQGEPGGGEFIEDRVDLPIDA